MDARGEAGAEAWEARGAVEVAWQEMGLASG